MRLMVNGIQIRVVDRIEVVLETAKDGDTLLNGIQIIAKGGPLQIFGRPGEAALYVNWDGLDYSPDGWKIRMEAGPETKPSVFGYPIIGGSENILTNRNKIEES